MVAVKFVVILAILSPCVVQAFWPFRPTPLWTSLKTTFALDGVLSGLPLIKTTAYQAVPRTTEGKEAKGWVKVSTTCENNGQFNGYRYIFGNDNSVSALYDNNGIIVGIQMNIKVSDAKANNNTFQFDNVPMYQLNTFEGDEMYTLTAYFVEPGTICPGGRSADALANEGTGNRLSLQNGPSPADLIEIPKNRTVALGQGWSDNKCFVGMGVHNWYKQEQFQDDDCNTILPVFLLYNKQNELIGFGFQHVGKSVKPRFEQPSTKAVKLIVGDKISPCLIEKSDTIGITTMHVYFIDNPMLSQNCLI